MQQYSGIDDLLAVNYSPKKSNTNYIIYIIGIVIVLAPTISIFWHSTLQQYFAVATIGFYSFVYINGLINQRITAIHHDVQLSEDLSKPTLSALYQIDQSKSA